MVMRRRLKAYKCKYKDERPGLLRGVDKAPIGVDEMYLSHIV